MDSTSATAVHPIQLMLPIVQTGSVNPKQRICLHHKKKELLPPAVTGTSINVETYVEIQTTRNNSVTSTAPLISGGRSPGLYLEAPNSEAPIIEGGILDNNTNQRGDGSHRGDKKGFFPCWKCLFEEWGERTGKFWGQVSSCLCFVCCGYECDDESTIYGGYGFGTGSEYFEQCTEGRQHVLQQTPASMV